MASLRISRWARLQRRRAQRRTRALAQRIREAIFRYEFGEEAKFLSRLSPRERRRHLEAIDGTAPKLWPAKTLAQRVDQEVEQMRFLALRLEYLARTYAERVHLTGYRASAATIVRAPDRFSRHQELGQALASADWYVLALDRARELVSNFEPLRREAEMVAREGGEPSESVVARMLELRRELESVLLSMPQGSVGRRLPVPPPSDNAICRTKLLLETAGIALKLAEDRQADLYERLGTVGEVERSRLDACRRELDAVAEVFQPLEAAPSASVTRDLQRRIDRLIRSIQAGPEVESAQRLLEGRKRFEVAADVAQTIRLAVLQMEQRGPGSRIHLVYRGSRDRIQRHLARAAEALARGETRVAAGQTLGVFWSLRLKRYCDAILREAMWLSTRK